MKKETQTTIGEYVGAKKEKKSWYLISFSAYFSEKDLDMLEKFLDNTQYSDFKISLSENQDY